MLTNTIQTFTQWAKTKIEMIKLQNDNELKMTLPIDSDEKA